MKDIIQLNKWKVDTSEPDVSTFILRIIPQYFKRGVNYE